MVSALAKLFGACERANGEAMDEAIGYLRDVRNDDAQDPGTRLLLNCIIRVLKRAKNEKEA